MPQKKLIIGVHPNENTPREPNPHVPWTPEEIARDAAACRAAGASLMHYHARTADGAPDHSPESYRAIARAVRARTDLLLAPSQANAPGADAERRLAGAADPEADPGTCADLLVMDMGCAVMDLFDPARGAFATTGRVLVNDTATHQLAFARARRLGLTPYLASFTVGWTRTILAHLAAGAFEEPAVIAFILGGPEFLPAHPLSVAGLDAHLAFLPPDRAVEWIVSAHRGDVLEVAEEVILRGGHLAVGVGDFAHPGRGMPTNAELVAEVAGLARRLGREVATPAEARRMLGVREVTPCAS